MGFLKCCSPNNNWNESENYPGEGAAIGGQSESSKTTLAEDVIWIRLFCKTIYIFIILKCKAKSTNLVYIEYN